MKKSELKKLIREEIQALNELTTWEDIKRKLPNNFPPIGQNYAPDLKGWKLMYIPTKKKFDVKSTDEKFIQINKKLDRSKYEHIYDAHGGGSETPVGDGLIYSKKWVLIDPDGNIIKTK